MAPINLVCIGDSTTHEPVGNAYPFQLQGITGGDVVVIGTGIRGTNVPFWITQLAVSVFPLNPLEVAVLIGINDVRSSVDAPTIEGGLATIYQAIAAAGAKPRPLTLTPFGLDSLWTSALERARQAVNAWIRALALDSIDLDPAVSDLTDPMRPVWKAGMDQADRLHPNETGAAAMAQAVYSGTFG